MNEEPERTCHWCDGELDENDNCTHRSCINFKDEYDDPNDCWE